MTNKKKTYKKSGKITASSSKNSIKNTVQKNKTQKPKSSKSTGHKLNFSKKYTKKAKNKSPVLLIIAAVVLAVSIAAILIGIHSSGEYETVKLSDSIRVTEAFLTPNEYSRPEIALENINGIVIHYTANPGSTAMQNRDYFEGLKDGTDGTYASSHFIIGLDGEIVQCIPLTEEAYASNDRNSDTISIECCHPDESGEFTDETYDSLINLVCYLCQEYNISPDNIIRHYDVTGKLCPKYYVEHEDKWEELLSDVKEKLE